jgi:hypothetical protein
LVFSTRVEDLLAGVAGCLERLGALAQELLWDRAETNFEPGRRSANELDFQDQLDAWFVKASRPARLPHGPRERRPARPARHRQDPPLDRPGHSRLPGRLPRRLSHRRYERASLIVTSNKPFSGWGEIFGDDSSRPP